MKRFFGLMVVGLLLFCCRTTSVPTASSVKDGDETQMIEHCQNSVWDVQIFSPGLAGVMEAKVTSAMDSVILPPSFIVRKTGGGMQKTYVAHDPDQFKLVITMESVVATSTHPGTLSLTAKQIEEDVKFKDLAVTCGDTATTSSVTVLGDYDVLQVTKATSAAKIFKKAKALKFADTMMPNGSVSRSGRYEATLLDKDNKVIGQVLSFDLKNPMNCPHCYNFQGLVGTMEWHGDREPASVKMELHNPQGSVEMSVKIKTPTMICPPAGAINCMPVTTREDCEPQKRQWIEQHCPDVSFLD